MKVRLTKEWFAAPLAYFSAVVAALLLGAVFIILFTDANPISAYGDFFSESFLSKYGIFEVLSKATPIMIAGAGMILAFRCGLWNLGAEGQMAIGAMVTTALGLYVGVPGYVLLPLIFLVSFASGGVWSGISGVLKVRFGVHEMLSTLMMNYIALKLLDYLINGPMSMPNPMYPRTSEILPQAQLPFLQYPLNFTFIFAILLVPAIWFLINRTTFGYRLKAVGTGPRAARLAGMSISALTLSIMALSGAISALGGTVLIVGDFFRMEKNVTGGYGFTAIVVVMIARSNIIALPFVSIFVAGMLVGATSLTLAGIPATFSQILVGLLLLCTVFASWLQKKLARRWEAGGTVDGRPPEHIAEQRQSEAEVLEVSA
jgi:simple sugar transport system permease protein